MLILGYSTISEFPYFSPLCGPRSNEIGVVQCVTADYISRTITQSSGIQLVPSLSIESSKVSEFQVVLKSRQKSSNIFAQAEF